MHQCLISNSSSLDEAQRGAQAARAPLMLYDDKDLPVKKKLAKVLGGESWQSSIEGFIVKGPQQ